MPMFFSFDSFIGSKKIWLKRNIFLIYRMGHPPMDFVNDRTVFFNVSNVAQFIRINYKFTRFNLPASSVANLGRQVITKRL